MTTFIKTNLIVLLFVITTFAENKVFTDTTFPYRVVCTSEWVELVKNDTLLQIKNTSPGKKTRLELQKYPIDSGFSENNYDWSRFRYAINLDLILGLGKVGFVDTSSSKKLGGFRAFEIFSYHWEKTDDQTLWYAAYTRWTNVGGFGYMASIIGDTLDMKENIKNKNYVKFMDSISLSLLQTNTLLPAKHVSAKIPGKHSIGKPLVWYDFLGRNLQASNCQHLSTIIVRKNMTRCLVK
jgi:hypothetical protein